MEDRAEWTILVRSWLIYFSAIMRPERGNVD